MKLKNKKTGEIRNAVDIDMYTDSVYLKVSDGEFDNETIEYRSLADLNEEWEDVPEEPKEFWYIYGDQVLKAKCDGVIENMNKPIGNYFETKEEAEKAVERLKKLQNLKNRGYNIDEYIDTIIERGEE